MIIAALAGLALLITNLDAADRVVVYVDNDSVVSQDVEWRAECLAKRMFARIGVAIDWRAGKRNGEAAAIQVTMVRHAPASRSPGALGYAEVSAHSPGHVFVIAERMNVEALPGRAYLVLAHVLVHEITHVLEGVSRHTETGIMKARWTFADYGQMAKMLKFTPVDINLIHYRLAHR